MSEDGDRALVRAFLEGRAEQDFRALYRLYTPRLYATAMRLTSDARQSADAVHDTWVRAVDALPTFGWRSSLATWLTGILVNRLRESRREEARDLAHEPVDEEALEAPAPLDGESAIVLREAIAALPTGSRTVLVLHDVEGYTHREIGAMLGIDPGTSKSQLFRARALLRSALTDEDDQ